MQASKYVSSVRSQQQKQGACCARVYVILFPPAQNIDHNTLVYVEVINFPVYPRTLS